MARDSAFPDFSEFGFWGNDPNVNQQLRQRIALQLMANNKKGFPKNIGEGLTSIGDALGEMGMTRRLEAADLAQQKAAEALRANPAAAVAPGARTAYAPPGDTGSDAPAPGEGPVATAAPMDTAADLTPEEAKAGVSSGDYNLLDAQAGMKRTGQGRVQDAVMSAYPNNPDMQAYASQLAAGEQQVPGDTSKTGARGPWQFVPGTAKQYGLTNPDDPMASAQALKAFTANNAAIFQRINGRPPTMAELAVMHQQGGQTGANMIAGTGNAPPRNLALNNIPAGAGPAQAVGAIKNYYGMPDRPVNARDAVAQAMMMRPTARAVPQPNPTSTGGPTMPPTSPTGQTPIPSTPASVGGQDQGPPPDQRLAFNGLPPEIATGVSAAPPVPSQLRATPAPPQQVAQAQPQPGFGYVRPKPADVPVPNSSPVQPAETRAQELMQRFPNNSYVQQQQGQIVKEEQAKRAILDQRINEQFTRAQNMRDQQELARQTEIATRAEREAKGIETTAAANQAAAGAIITRNTGLPPATVEADFKARQPSADKDISLIRNARLAKWALENGVVSGIGADLHLNLERAKAVFGDIPASELASRSERAIAATKAMVGYGLNQYQPGDTRVTNSDTIVSGQIVGGDPSQQLQTRKELVNMVLQDSNARVADYERRHDIAFKGSPAAEMYRLRTDPIDNNPAVAKAWTETLLKPENIQNPRAIEMFDKRFGPGSAELEIARAGRQIRKAQ